MCHFYAHKTNLPAHTLQTIPITWPFEGLIQGTRGGRGSEWGPIKYLLEGDGNSCKTNSASNTLL
jgi:hypothetical protein